MLGARATRRGERRNQRNGGEDEEADQCPAGP